MAGRNIPIQLASHLAMSATTTCRLWKVMPLEGPPFGLTSLDRDVTYDDGTGVLVYRSKHGYTPYAIETSADLAVDNSEMQVLIAEFEVDGFTTDAIRRGVYDDARFVEYLVNYEDLAQGRVIMSSGTVGRIRQVDGMVCFPESRSLTQQLKQKSIIELGSNNCRCLALGDERCKVDVDALWVDAEVADVGLETDRVFTIEGDDVAPEDDAYWPGLFEFFTGANAGRSYEVESYIDGVITLAIPTEVPIAAGDTGRVRRDCTRLWDGHNGCASHNNRPNFRGEPWRPVSESERLSIPGAGGSSPGGFSETAQT